MKSENKSRNFKKILTLTAYAITAASFVFVISDGYKTGIELIKLAKIKQAKILANEKTIQDLLYMNRDGLIHLFDADPIPLDNDRKDFFTNNGWNEYQVYEKNQQNYLKKFNLMSVAATANFINSSIKYNKSDDGLINFSASAFFKYHKEHQKDFSLGSAPFTITASFYEPKNDYSGILIEHWNVTWSPALTP